MRFALIEPLRGLAAMWVFAFHFPFSSTTETALPLVVRIAGIGFLGVPMFFVLSGYCISVAAHSAINSNRSSLTFLVRRLKRIYPAYWLSIVVVAALPFLQELLSILKSGTYTAPSADNINYGFLTFAWHDWLNVAALTQVFANMPHARDLQSKFTGINAVYWTLAIEVQFYFVVTAALSCRRHFYPILAILTGLSFVFIGSSTWTLRGIFLPHWPMFAIGVATHVLHEQGIAISRMSPFPARAIAIIIGLQSSVVIWLSLKSAQPNSLLFAIGFAGILFLLEGVDRGFVKIKIRSQFKLVRILAGLICTIGTMSYSLYLLHGRVQYLSLQVARQFISVGGVIHDVSAIILTCLASYLFHRLCERPFLPITSASRSIRTISTGV